MEEFKVKFTNLMRDIKTMEERIQFLKWIHSNWDLGKKNKICSFEAMHLYLPLQTSYFHFR